MPRNSPRFPHAGKPPGGPQETSVGNNSALSPHPWGELQTLAHSADPTCRLHLCSAGWPSSGHQALMPHGTYFISRMTFSALSPTSVNHPGERIRLARDTNIELYFNPYLISLGYGSQTPCSCLGFPLLPYGSWYFIYEPSNFYIKQDLIYFFIDWYSIKS